MLQAISEIAICVAEQAVITANSLQKTSESMEQLRKMAADTLVMPSQEEPKADLIRTYSDMRDNLITAADVIERGPMKPDELRDEIFNSLCSGYRAYHIGKELPHALEQFFLERARNLSQAYAGRVAREPK